MSIPAITCERKEAKALPGMSWLVYCGASVKACRRSADHSLLDAIHSFADVLCGSLVHLPGGRPALLASRRRVGGSARRFLPHLSSYFIRISNRQSLGASLVDVYRRSHQRVHESTANANRGIASRVLLRDFDEIDALVTGDRRCRIYRDAVGRPRTGNSIVEPIASLRSDISWRSRPRPSSHHDIL